jgi:hypothetical protein
MARNPVTQSRLPKTGEVFTNTPATVARWGFPKSPAFTTPAIIFIVCSDPFTQNVIERANAGSYGLRGKI